MSDTIAILGMPFLVCTLLASMLGYLGIHVVKREIIFVDIAMAQIAAVGGIVAHLLFDVHDDSIVAFLCGMAMIGLAAVFFATARVRLGQVSLEAIIGVTYAVSAGAALFLVGIAPGGHMHMQALLSGNLLWTSQSDLLWMGAVFSPVIAVLYLARRPLSCLGEAQNTTRHKTLVWDVVFYLILGMVITLAVRLAGIVVVFAYLVIPATLSLMFSLGWLSRVLVVWGLGIGASGLGLIFAYQLDFSVGPSVALFLGLGLILTTVIKQARGWVAKVHPPSITKLP